MIAQKTRKRNELEGIEKVVEVCRTASELEDAGRYEEAAEMVGEFWRIDGVRPQGFGELPLLARAELLARVGSLTGWLGSSLQIEGWQEKAKDLLSESLRLFEEERLNERLADVESDLAICYWREGAFSEAWQFLEDAIGRLPKSASLLKGKLMLRQANVAISTNRFDAALELVEEAGKSIIGGGDELLIGKFYFHRGLIAKLKFEEGGKDQFALKAIADYQQASRHYRIAGHERYEAVVENNLAELHRALCKFEEAHEHLNNAVCLFESFKDAGRIASVYDSKSRVFLDEGRLVEAALFAQKSVQIFRDGDEHSSLAESLATLGIVSARSGSAVEARAAFDEAIEHASFVGDVETAATVKLTCLEEIGDSMSPVERSQMLAEAEQSLSGSGSQAIVNRLQSVAWAWESGESNWDDFVLTEKVHEFEAHYIKKALLQCDGSVTKAARLLGVSHQHLSLLLKKRHSDLAYAKKQRKRRSDRKKKSAVKKS